MTAPFVILALPRSRTAWLSKLLTHGGWQVGHEVAIEWRSIDDALRYFAQPMIGSIETGPCLAWRLFLHHGIKVAVVRRPVGEVVRSFMNMEVPGYRYEEAMLHLMMERNDRALAKCARQPGVLSINHRDLDDEQTIRRLWEHCLPQPFDRDHWLAWRERNVDIGPQGIAGYVTKYHENLAAITRFKADVKHELRRLAYAGAIRSEHA